MSRLLQTPFRPLVPCRVQRWPGNVEARDQLLEEVPVAIACNGETLAVLLATPQELDELALGFALTEGVVESAAEVHDLRVAETSAGAVVQLAIPAERMAAAAARRRLLPARSGCGACGLAELGAALPEPRPVGDALRLSAPALHAALAAMPALQRLNARAGSAHAAAWIDGAGRIHCLREDVGRHNALDKLVGALLARRMCPAGGAVLVTSRASVELVQKCAAAGVELLAAVSAPTALAVRYADAAGITLVGFARASGHVRYSHPRRLMPDE